MFLSSLHVPVGRPSGFREHPGFVLSLKGNAFNNYAFLVLPSGLRDLSSPSGDQTRATCSGRETTRKAPCWQTFLTMLKKFISKANLLSF